jgi:hypothetical protein
MLHIDLEMILQVFTDARKMMYDVDAKRCQMICIADARKLQQLRRVDGAAATDDFSCKDLAQFAAMPVFDANGPAALE